ncbi:MAG: EscU/YscU/HrcU family type III secretion system export apparatus switch protein [Ottowia sp.]|nr:EscU/YscU/HrcU family type III secretion system export apparatus switch protein [Ottowia sp.]
MSEKSHDATDKRLEQMRKEGKTARSQDIGRILVVAVLAEVILMLRSELFSVLHAMQVFSLSRIGTDFSRASVEVIWYVTRTVFIYSLGVVVLASFVRILADTLQFGWVFSPKALRINVAKLNPMQKIQQLFGKTQLWELLMTVIKLIVLIGVGLLALQTMFSSVVYLIYGEGSMGQVWDMMVRILIWQVRSSTMALILMAAADFMMQKKFYLDSSRMDFQEIKQEMREGDGDPEAKHARRSMGQAWLEEEPEPRSAPSGDVQSVLSQTDLLITNPTHIAIALSYQSGLHPLPIVVHKLQDKKALAFMHEARACGIALQRNPWLARHLFAHCAVGQAITHKALLPVAEYYRDLVYAKPARVRHLTDITSINTIPR